MFLRCSTTKASLTFLTAIMGLDILNNILKHFLQKIPVKTSFCREYCGQSEIVNTKLKAVFVPKSPIYKNLFHFLHIYFGLRNTKVSLDPNFAEFLEENAQKKLTVSDLDALSSTKSWDQIRILFVVIIYPWV